VGREKSYVRRAMLAAHLCVHTGNSRASAAAAAATGARGPHGPTGPIRRSRRELRPPQDLNPTLADVFGHKLGGRASRTVPAKPSPCADDDDGLDSEPPPGPKEIARHAAYLASQLKIAGSQSPIGPVG
jgi:hypothetical protein